MNLTLCSAMCSLHRKRNVISNQNEDICVAEVNSPMLQKLLKLAAYSEQLFFAKFLGNVFN